MQFPALANKWWEWKAVKAEAIARQLEDQQKQKELRDKYGRWMGQAKANKQGPLCVTKPTLSKVFLDFMEEELISVESDQHFCTATSASGKVLKFWIANRMFAYANQGKLEDKDGKELFRWYNEMPDYWVCFMLVEKVENHIFNS